MSFDLFVFDPEQAPSATESLDNWFVQQVKSDQCVEDPSILTNRLRAFFDQMQTDFPALNGPSAPDDIEALGDAATDYSLLPGSIYMGFRWSAATRAEEAVFQCAERNGLGLFDPQRGSGSGWYWPVNGTFEPVRSLSSAGPKDWFGKLFKRV